MKKNLSQFVSERLLQYSHAARCTAQDAFNSFVTSQHIGYQTSLNFKGISDCLWSLRYLPMVSNQHDPAKINIWRQIDHRSYTHNLSWKIFEPLISVVCITAVINNVFIFETFSDNLALAVANNILSMVVAYLDV